MNSTASLPLAHWADALQQWAIPEHILSQAPQSPWIHPVENFRPHGDLFVDVPSRMRALEALPTNGNRSRDKRFLVGTRTCETCRRF